MCPRRVELKYKEGCARYDTKTRDMLNTFLESGKVEPKFAPRQSLYKNICYLNSTRQKVTKDLYCCDRFTVGKQSYKGEFMYEGKKEKYNFWVDMPMLATTNLKSEEVYNIMEFEVEYIDSQTVTIADTVFPIDKFAHFFIPAFCCTVYKYQGADINDPLYIYNNVNRMDKKQLYTALSCTAKYEYIHLNNRL